MLCYSFRLILYVYGVLENDGQLIMSGSMMNNPCLGCVEINTNFILYENRITNPDALKDFTWEGFRYREDISSENNWIFLQD